MKEEEATRNEEKTETWSKAGEIFRGGVKGAK